MKQKTTKPTVFPHEDQREKAKTFVHEKLVPEFRKLARVGYKLGYRDGLFVGAALGSSAVTFSSFIPWKYSATLATVVVFAVIITSRIVQTKGD